MGSSGFVGPASPTAVSRDGSGTATLLADSCSDGPRDRSTDPALEVGFDESARCFAIARASRDLGRGFAVAVAAEAAAAEPLIDNAPEAPLVLEDGVRVEPCGLSVLSSPDSKGDLMPLCLNLSRSKRAGDRGIFAAW